MTLQNPKGTKKLVENLAREENIIIGSRCASLGGSNARGRVRGVACLSSVSWQGLPGRATQKKVFPHLSLPPASPPPVQSQPPSWLNRAGPNFLSSCESPFHNQSIISFHFRPFAWSPAAFRSTTCRGFRPRGQCGSSRRGMW